MSEAMWGGRFTKTVDEMVSLFPDTLKRGVLSEDAVYNLLERFQEVREDMRRLAQA